jgi:secretion/DNA translocation related TadE-like protein
MTGESRGCRHRDGGFATVWVVLSMALVAATAGMAICYGAATLERHRADAAADAVALEVALRALDGPAIACRRGATLGQLDGAEIIRCELDGAVADIVVAVRLPGPLSWLGPASGEARAGPASEAITPSIRRSPP